MTGLRLVPSDPSPADFPPRKFACDERDAGRFSPCPYCDVEVCLYGKRNAVSTNPKPPRAA